MKLKEMSAGTACIILFALLTAWCLSRQKYTPSYTNGQIIAINELLYKLRKECIMGQIDVAQNTVEDVKQEWGYLDVMLQHPTG